MIYSGMSLTSWRINTIQKKFQINWLGDKSFTRQYVLNEPITKYNRKEIITKGLLIQMKVYYEHKICNEFISCPMMKTSESENPSKCPIYSAMQKECQLNQENLDHLDEHSHFKNEYEQKPECKQGQQCKPFIRLENGGNGIADRCHLKLFRHPPRTRNIELAKNIKSFIFNKQKKANHALHKPSNDRGDWKHHTMLRGFLKLLIDEVICNGYKRDLCMKCSNNYGCKHDVYDSNNQYSILKVVDEKMKHHRHKLMGQPLNKGQMLAIVLYTGCDCNY
eukprot:406029_1